MIFLCFLLFAPPKELALDEFGISLQFPESWLLRIEGVSPMLAVGKRPPKEGLFLLSRSQNGGDSAATHYLETMGKSFATHKIQSDGPATMGEIPGRLIHLEGERGATKLHHLTFIFEGFGETFTLTLATEAEKFVDLHAELSGIAGSLRFSGPPHFATTQDFMAELAKPDYQLGRLGELKAAGADLNARNRHHQSPLMTAALRRDGVLFRWLLEQGADPDSPANDPKLLKMVLSPPMKKLLSHRRGAPPEQSPSHAAGIHWRTPEDGLIAGIMNDRPEYVREALEKGANLAAQEPNYRLAALPLTEKLIAEFKELDLDPGTLPEILNLLQERSANH